jgi:Dolichyl-phosphate-mannose-protein mannosyltransferase
MRVTAAVVAGLVVAATMLLTRRLAGGRITAVTAGLLTATVGASPFVESFTLSGELLASLPAVLSLVAFVGYLSSRRRRWLVLAGALTGTAVLMKQSAFDGGLAAVAFLLWRERRQGVAPAGILIAAALVPVAAAAVSAARLNDWLYAVVGYRFHGDSLVTGSVGARFHQLWMSLPPAAKALGLLALLAAIGWRRAPDLARIWLGAACFGVLGGGNFHPHYYLQLVPPLAVLGAVGVRTLWYSWARPGLGVAFAGAAASLALALPVALASPAKQAKEIWPHDPHLVHDGALADYVRTHTQPHQRVLALWADADLYYLADRTPAIRFLWARNVASVPGALAGVHWVLANRRAALVLVVQPLRKLDPTGGTARLLRRDYYRVATVRGVGVYRSRRIRKTTATARPSAATRRTAGWSSVATRTRRTTSRATSP